MQANATTATNAEQAHGRSGCCVNLEGVEKLKASALADLVVAAARCHERGDRVKLVRCGAALRRTLRAADVAHLFDFWRGDACCAAA